MGFPSDLEIARGGTIAPLVDIAKQMGIGPHLLEPYGDSVAKIKLEAIEELADRPRARYVVVSAVTPTPLGEGKTTTTVGLGQALQPHRQEGNDLPAPARHGSHVRDQGRGRRRGLQPGRPHGAVEPAPHRRLPRRHRGPQPAVGDPRQPPPPGQPAGSGPAQHHLAAGARRQRPGPAQHRDRAGHQGGRRHPPDRIRHHGRIRGHGHAWRWRPRWPTSTPGSAASSSATPTGATR